MGESMRGFGEFDESREDFTVHMLGIFLVIRSCAVDLSEHLGTGTCLLRHITRHNYISS